MTLTSDRCFTVMQLARRRWCCRPSRVRALIKAGALKAFVLGNRVLIPPEAVAEFERGQQVAPVKAKQTRRQAVDFVEYY